MHGCRHESKALAYSFASSRVIHALVLSSRRGDFCQVSYSLRNNLNANTLKNKIHRNDSRGAVRWAIDVMTVGRIVGFAEGVSQPSTRIRFVFSATLPLLMLTMNTFIFRRKLKRFELAVQFWFVSLCGAELRVWIAVFVFCRTDIEWTSNARSTIHTEAVGFEVLNANKGNRSTILIENGIRRLDLVFVFFCSISVFTYLDCGLYWLSVVFRVHDAGGGD